MRDSLPLGCTFLKPDDDDDDDAVDAAVVFVLAAFVDAGLDDDVAVECMVYLMLGCVCNVWCPRRLLPCLLQYYYEIVTL